MTVEPTVVSLFSGAGGLDLGFRDAGFRIAAATDNDRHAGLTHATNFPESHFYLGDIADLTEGSARQSLGISDEQAVDVLIGGPPCPPFSKSRFYRTDMPKGMLDPVGQATISGYLRMLKVFRPKAFLLENVPGMAFKIHAETLLGILTQAGDLGYDCKYKILNAADYGVPQTRQRFFIVGVRRDLGVSFEWPEATHMNPDKPVLQGLSPWVTAGAAINDLDTEENASDVGHVAGGKHRHLLAEIPPGDNYLYFTERRGHPNPQFEWRKRYWSFLLKLSPDMPSWTIQARRSNNMGPLHWRNRILRIEEVRRLQSFPDSWDLVGTVEQQWRQVGNAVPPLLATALAASICKTLEIAEGAR